VVRIKICGLKDPGTAEAAAKAGAHYLGLVFAPGNRQLDPGQAREIALAVRGLRRRPRLVGVFAGHTTEEVNRLVEYCRLDIAQLSGGEDWGFCRRIKAPLIKAVHIPVGTGAEEVVAWLEEGYRLFSREALTFLLDTAVAGKSGGTGRSFDWSIAREAAAKMDIMIAGGLDPGNVGRLLREVRPWGVDVSSGVETGGKKDPAKILAFITKVRECAKLMARSS
jgi:phosphoribosylanthranilate isomerase